MKNDNCKTISDLKELLITRIDSIEKLTDERFISQDKALSLQTNEFMRRLDMLNGEAERLRLMQQTYVQREMWEATNKNIQEKIAELEKYKNNMIGRYSIISIVISTLIGIIFLIANNMWR